MATGLVPSDLFILHDSSLQAAYVDALSKPLKVFLLEKGAGHCQRVDYLARPVMEGLGEKLSAEPDLQAQRVAVRVVTDRDADLRAWEVSGSGAVKLREDATYGRVKVFCALFPSGLRLAEEDSLNIATFKTDDAESFNVERQIEGHLNGLVNLRPDEERQILRRVLDHADVRNRTARHRLRYVLSVIGQAEKSGRPVDWELAGAYLYELDLVPDFDLSGSVLVQQIARNRQCVSILTDGEKSLGQNVERLTELAELDDEDRRRELLVHLADKRVLKTEEWLPSICHDGQIRDRLSFDTWKFSQPLKGLKVELKPLKDPKTGKIVAGLVEKGGALTSDGKKAIQIKWTISPKEHGDLGRFRVSVIRKTQDEGEVDVIPPQQVAAKRKSFSIPIDQNTLGDDEQCVAVIRIQALTKTGLPFQDADDESEEFWIEQGEEIVDAPKERGKRIQHLDDVRFLSTHATGKTYEVRSRGWDVKRDHVFSIRLTNNQRGDLVMTPMLLELERKILHDPGSLGIFEANLVNRRQGRLEDFKEHTPTAPATTAAEAFFRARTRLFEEVRDVQEGTGVIEVADLHDMRDLVFAYVESYLQMLRAVRERIAGAPSPGGVNNVLRDLSDLLRIDTVLMRVGPDDKPMEVALLAPTHPLRVLWLYQYQTLLRHWISRMEGRKPDEIRALIDESVLDKLTSMNIPHALAWNKGTAYVNTDNLGLFWGIYPAGELSDLRSAVNAVLQGVGASPLGGSISTITPRQIAEKILRYLSHHPYVNTLKINVINPGDGRLILEAIKALLEQELYGDLNFDLRFFSPSGTRHQLVGSAFDDFMGQRSREDWTFGLTLSETEERLLSPNENPLFPKLIYGKYEVGDLLSEDSQRFNAHLTFVIDYFGTTVSARTHTGEGGSSSLHNLLAEYVTDYVAGGTTATWSRMIAPTRCPDLASDGNTARLHQSHDLLGHEAASLFSWNKALDEYVTIQLELTDDNGKNHLKMLERVHEVSDWVFTIDRNFGIEYFDDPIKGAGAGGYLIDYTPEFLDGVAHRLIISTYHQQEIESILRHGFFDLLNVNVEQEGETIDTAKIAEVLGLLKSVSGKLALKLINNPTQAQEVIGLALTRLALEKDGRLRGRVLIPVDSHIDLFYQSQKELENAELTLKRTDLMLAELRDGRLHIDLIEVKNRKTATPGGVIDLHAQIREKNESTERHFRHHFMGVEEQRLDAVIKSKQLTNILLFYFERACRYGLYSPDGEVLCDSRAEFIKALESVAAGSCEITFGHEGFIFNGSSYNERDTKEVHGNKISQFGRPDIAKLLGLGLDDDRREPDGDEGDAGDDGTEAPTPPAPTATGHTAPVPPRSPEVGSPTAFTPQPSEEPAPPSTAPTETRTEERAQIAPCPREAATEKTLSEPPPEASFTARVYLGKDAVTGREIHWDPQATKPKRLLNQHMLIVGKSGAGKSETTKSMLYELDRQGVPSIIFDFQGEYASGDFQEVVQPQVFDVMNGLPINPFEIPLDPVTRKRRRPVEMMFRLADTLNAVFAGSGDIQLGKLREAIKECYIQAGFDMNTPAPEEQEPPTLEMLCAVLDHWSQDKGGQVRNLQVRLQPLFESGIFGQGRTDFSFDDLFKKTTVILLTAGIKDLMLAASRFLLEKIYAAMVMSGLSKQLKIMVCVDEAHKLCNDPKITDLAKEARKYGLGLILSSQETRDFHQSIIANAGTQIVLALEDADATIMARQFHTQPAEQRAIKELIMKQESGRALVRSTHFEPYVQCNILSFENRVQG